MAFASGRRLLDYALWRSGIGEYLTAAAICVLLLVASCAVHDPAAPYNGAAEPVRKPQRPSASQNVEPGSVDGAAAQRKKRLADLRPRLKPDSNSSEASNRPVQRPIKLPALLGLNHHSIAKIFGRPSNVERNGPSVIWNYDTPRCSLQIVFYGDIENQTYHALQYALADSNGEEPRDAERCLDGIQSENRDGQG